MKIFTVWSYVILPAVAFTIGIQAGIKYAKSVYVSKDRKFIEGERIDKQQENA